MPYNTTAIPPKRDATGTATLPLSRVKKIIAMDQDISMCSNNAAFVITIATELFIQHLAEKAHNVVQSERKPRRNIQYRDLSSAVSRADSLEFLIDVVPKTIPFKHAAALTDRQPNAQLPNSNPAFVADTENGQMPLRMNGAGAAAAEDNGHGPWNGKVAGLTSNGGPKTGTASANANANARYGGDGQEARGEEWRGWPAERERLVENGAGDGDGDVEMK